MLGPRVTGSHAISDPAATRRDHLYDAASSRLLPADNGALSHSLTTAGGCDRRTYAGRR